MRELWWISNLRMMWEMFLYSNPVAASTTCTVYLLGITGAEISYVSLHNGTWVTPVGAVRMSPELFWRRWSYANDEASAGVTDGLLEDAIVWVPDDESHGIRSSSNGRNTAPTPESSTRWITVNPTKLTLPRMGRSFGARMSKRDVVFVAASVMVLWLRTIV